MPPPVSPTANKSENSGRRRLLAAFLLFVLVGVGVLVLVGSELRARGDGAVSQHIQRADMWRSDSRQWQVPPNLASADDPVPAAQSQWQSVNLPHARARQVAGDMGETATPKPDVVWYRLRLPASAMAESHQGVRLYIPRWQTVGTVGIYLDGELLWQTRGSPVWNSFNYPVWIDLEGKPRGRDASLLIRMASVPSVGGALSSVWVGPAEELLSKWRIRTALQTGLLGVSLGSYLVIGCFALVFWLLRSTRGEKIYLLFFFMAVSHVLAGLQFLVDGEGITISDDWFSWITQFGLMATGVCSFYFLCMVQRQHRPWLLRSILAFTAIVLLATLPLWGLRHEAILPLMRMALIPPEICVFILAVRGAWQARSMPSIWVAGWILLSFPIGIYDLALQSYWVSVEGVYLTPYVYIGLFTLFMVIAFTRYIGALDTAENANAHLAERMQEQERALALAHARLLEAEREQTLLQERQRLMREMHDGVGSSLMTALRLIERGDAAQINLLQVLQECIDDLKISIDSLEPMDHDLLALLASLRFRLGPRLEGAGLKLSWDQVQDVPALPWLDAQSALHILRILQEVLTNIIKHSDAQHISLCTREAMLADEPGVQVEVIDDGDGFLPPSDLSTNRKGLSNVRARAKVLGGQADWQALEPKGNRFILWLPLARQH